MKLLLSLIMYLLVFMPFNLFGLVEGVYDEVPIKRTVEGQIMIYYMFQIGDRVFLMESNELKRVIRMSPSELREYKKNVLNKKKRPHQPRGVTP